MEYRVNSGSAFRIPNPPFLTPNSTTSDPHSKHSTNIHGAGLIKETDAPTGTNITGKVYTVSGKAKIEMVLRLVGRPSSHKPVRFGYIHSTYPSSLGDLRELMKIAGTNDDITFVPYEIPHRTVPKGLPTMIEEVRKAIEQLKGEVDYWIEPTGPLGETMEYTKTLLEHSGAPIAIGQKISSVRRWPASSGNIVSISYRNW